MVRLAVVVSSLLLALVAAQPATASVTAATSVVTASGKTRLVVKLTSTGAVARRSRPRAVSVVAAGHTYKLSRAAAAAATVNLGTWRSAGYTGARATALQGLAGARVKVRLRSLAGSRTLASTIPAAGGNNPGGNNPGGNNPGGNTPLFTPPGHDITGNEAATAILPYLANSTFTDCVPSFPYCSVEERYGHFANATMYYCRLTPTVGADIINSAHAFQIIGADMHADGSWAVTLRVVSYGDALTYYTWSVTTAGVATGLYWGPGLTPGVNPASQSIGPLQWVRGARDCSY